MATTTKADIALKQIEEIRQEIEEIKKRVEKLNDLDQAVLRMSEHVNTFITNINGINVIGLNDDLERIITLIDGDDQRDIVGLRGRMAKTEDGVKQLVDERNKLKWILVGVGLTGVTNLGAIITLISKISQLMGMP